LQASLMGALLADRQHLHHTPKGYEPSPLLAVCYLTNFGVCTRAFACKGKGTPDGEPIQDTKHMQPNTRIHTQRRETIQPTQPREMMQHIQPRVTCKSVALLYLPLPSQTCMLMHADEDDKRLRQVMATKHRRLRNGPGARLSRQDGRRLVASPALSRSFYARLQRRVLVISITFAKRRAPSVCFCDTLAACCDTLSARQGCAAARCIVPSPPGVKSGVSV